MTLLTSPAELSLPSSPHEMTLLNPTNCIIGDHGVMIINKQVSVPLKWKRPTDTQAGLAKGAVGRKTELDDLHARLLAKKNTAVVSAGMTAAIQGQPAIGKSTLAAMYAGEHTADYEGGVIWLELGSSYVTADSINGLVQHMASLAYAGDPQSSELLKNYLFSAEITRTLMAGHGPILVIIDDVWHSAPLDELRHALPAEATIIMTTRDYDIALSLDERQGERGLLALDVLSREDARLLVQQAIPGLADAFIETLITGLDCHAYALVLATGTINRQRRTRDIVQVIGEILSRVQAGAGLGALPSNKIEDQERTRKFQQVLQYSYDYLLTGFEDGAEYQRRFRALGALAEGATFEAGVASGIWETNNGLETLVEFQNLGLIRLAMGEAAGRTRWSQHTILRAYALSLQTPAEQEALRRRHAMIYLTFMQTTENAGRFFVMTPDLPQLRHALRWTVDHDRDLAQSLLTNMAELLKNHNLGEEYLSWAETTLKAISKQGTPQQIAHALGIKGNALQAAATTAQRPARLCEALGCYREALDKLREVPLDYAITLNNMANLLRDLAGVLGEDRPARLREALGCYREALDKRREVPLAYAQTLNNMANLLSDLAGVPGENRPARLREALGCYREALDKLREVPLAYAQTLNNMAVLLSDLAGVPGEDRPARLREALGCYREALDKRREVPLDYAGTLNNMANLLSDLAGVPGEDRPARLREALGCYREALDKLREVPLAYAQTLNNMAVLLSDLTGVPGENRPARLCEALGCYREALDKLREVPLAYAQTLNNIANLLRDLAGVSGEDRPARLREALGCYREALDKLREVPLDYAQTLNNMAVLLSDLAGMPGENRPARLREALGASHAALRIFAGQQHVQYLSIGRRVLVGLIVTMGAPLFRTCWAEIAANEDYPALQLNELTNEFASQENLRDNEEWQARLASDPTFRQRLAELAFLVKDKEGLLDDDGDAVDLQALTSFLVAWVQTPDWDASETYLRQHQTELLTDEAETALQMLILRNNGNQTLQDHHQILRCRANRIDAVYQKIKGGRQNTDSNPLQVGILAFLRAENDEQARSLLLTQAALLLSVDAGQMLEQFQGSDTESQAHIQARKALWQQVRRERAAPRQVVPPELLHDTDRESPPIPRPATEQTYTVINPAMCQFGDNNVMINNFGTLTLDWKTPQELHPDRSSGAVGRANELQKLHQELQGVPEAAIVGKPTTSVQGMAGIGKSTLVALYASQYADQYPGGVLWLQMTPADRDPESVNPELNRIVTYAYRADAQAAALLQHAQFSPGAVQALLSGHGKLLIIVDDVWDARILVPIRAALPADAKLIVTTRDARIAQPMNRLELDVLSEADALTMITKQLPTLPDALQKKLAAAVGYHPLALSVLIGDLVARGDDEWDEKIAQVAGMVARGEGFELPLMDEAEREPKVEAALYFSYRAIGESRPHGLVLQTRFRTLGCFAQEGTFETSAAAALWQITEGEARDTLNTFVNRALLSRAGTASNRWKQHAILRGYALALQNADERLALPQRHTEYYLHLSEACRDSKPRDYDRLETAFDQIVHAFEWCQGNSPRMTSQVMLACRDFMMIRGRVALLSQWLRVLLGAVDQHQDRLGKANTLQSLGDLDRRLGNLTQARAHYEAALPLFEAEQDRLGKANTLRSLGDLDSRLGNLTQARAHYEAAFPLFEAEQARLGKANTLRSLGDLDSRLGNLTQARTHYEATLPLYEAEQDRLGKANTLQSLGNLDRRLGNLTQARAHYEAALPLYEAEQDRLGKANTLRSLGDLDSRLGDLTQARAHYEAALPLYEAEQDRLGKANTLQSLGDLDSRLGNLTQARAHYEAAFPLFEAEQARLGKANTLRSLGDLDRRLGNLTQARTHYEAALPLYEAEQARLGKANTLRSLGDLDSRLGNLTQARTHYEAALPLYEAEQARLGKANTLWSLGDLDSLLGNLTQARAHYEAAFPLFEAEQDRLGKANTLRSLGDLDRRLGNLTQARTHYEAALPLFEAEQAQLGKANTLRSLGDLDSRLGNLTQARAHYEAALPLFEAEQEPGGLMNTYIGLARLETSQGARESALQYYEKTFAIADNLPGFRDHSVVADWRIEYQALKAQSDDPTQAALQVLLTHVHDSESLSAVLKEHPVLLELDTLKRLAESIVAAHQADHVEMAMQAAAMLLMLLKIYQTMPAEGSIAQQEQFISLQELVLSPVGALGIVELLDELKDALGESLNTLGNTYSEQGQHQEAIGAYSRAVSHGVAFAMLYRNRAGEYIGIKSLAEAEADLHKAAELEPDARQLAQLWRELSVAFCLAGQQSDAIRAMQELSRRTTDEQRTEAIAALEALKAEHPEHETNLNVLINLIKEQQ